jgi:hypothetical protein
MRKRSLAILLSALLLLQALAPFADTAELGRLSSLVEHYREHCKEESISFAQFLSLHYSPDSEHSSSGDHPSLPLHSSIFSAHAPQPFFAAAAPALARAALGVVRILAPRSVETYAFLLCVSIFQPPKFPLFSFSA